MKESLELLEWGQGMDDSVGMCFARMWKVGCMSSCVSFTQKFDVLQLRLGDVYEKRTEGIIFPSATLLKLFLDLGDTQVSDGFPSIIQDSTATSVSPSL